MFAEAIDAHAKVAAVSPEWKWPLGHTLALAGRQEEARAIAAALEQTPAPYNTFGLVEIYAGLGDLDRAFQWLERAIAERYTLVPWIRLDRPFDPLHGDPRFAEIAGRLNIPEPSPEIARLRAARR